MEFAILGSLEVTVDGQVLDLGPPKQRAVLAVLLLNANQTVAVERLIEHVWGDAPPRTAAHSIQIYVSALRKRFEEAGARAVVETRAPGYVLLAEPDTVDAHRFEQLVASGGDQVRAGDASGAAEALQAALRLWRGPPLVEFTYAEFAQAHIRRLEELRKRAVEELAAAQLHLDRASEALTHLTTLLEQDPLREHARELQLLALYRCGRQAEALRTYEDVRRRLADELGLDPSAALQQLQGRILLQDPSLTPGTASPEGDRGKRNPFKGLRAFTEADAADFFGRRELVEEICRELGDGARLVALVGPSGCGKSSVAAAGVVPALRAGAVDGSESWQIAGMVPGSDPAQELAGALAAAAQQRVAAELAATATLRDGRRHPSSETTTLLLIDQFEELFTRNDDATAEAFLCTLHDTLSDGDGPVRALVSLRADFYDRPLLHAGFAELFTAHVVNLLPLAAGELEAAVTEPARRVGLDVEPALLAELVTDAAGQPGALPLFQYALTELFEHRDGNSLSLRSYRKLGGLHGALSRRAEDIYQVLSPPRQHIAEQVFLRLVTPGDGTRDVRRRASAREFNDLDLDPVETADVLDRFGRHRLLTFDRDPVSGDATVEVAHEALFEAWARLRGWIDAYRADLRRQERLTTAVAEWTGSGREDGYLLSGSRLEQYDVWSQQTPLLLSADARAFLAASREQRRVAQEQEAARRAQEDRLRSRARTRLWALFASVLLLAAVSTALVLAMVGDRPPDVALIYDRGAHVIAQQIRSGRDRAVEQFGVDVEERTPVSDATVGQAADQGVPLIIFHRGNVTEDHVAEHPESHFAILDYTGTPADNVTFLTFATHEGSFLVGAAAALTSETGRIGFIGGVDERLIWSFQAGFEAGVRHIDPTLEIDVVYLTERPDYSGYGSPTLAAQAATDLYRSGADVIYHAAGGSGAGLMEAAVAESRRQGRHLWAVGVDSDEYLVDQPEVLLGGSRLWRFGPADWKAHILTSMVKRYDVAVSSTIEDFQAGEIPSGERVFDLANGGVDYATSGGFVDGIRPRLEELKQDIIAGRIEVPTVPDDRSPPDEVGGNEG